MENPDASVLDDKVVRAAGAVHRPSESQGPSHVSSIPRRPVGGAAGDVTVVNAQANTPPPYSSDPAPDPVPEPRPTRGTGLQTYPGLPTLDYRQYAPPLFELSPDATTITCKATYLSENASALATLIRSLAKVPPKPVIVLQGKRQHRVDFNIKLNLMNLLVPDDSKSRIDYLRCVRTDEMACRGGQQPSLKPDLGPDAGLADWCQRFVVDPATVKTFTLERVVANLDMDWLEGKLRSLVAATNYNGVVTVQLQTTHAKVVVQSPDKINKFFTSMTTLFSGKCKYEVVKAVWPFATARNEERGRRCIVQSEKTWWDEWKDPIRYAIVTRRQGWVTNEDKLEYIMEGQHKNPEGPDWSDDV